MQKTLFGQERLSAWERALYDRKPGAIVEAEMDTIPQVDAVRVDAMTVGAALRFALREGEEVALRLNPVAARFLAQAILSQGRAAGWLDGQYFVIDPPFRHDA